jgi:hypothetical protein
MWVQESEPPTKCLHHLSFVHHPSRQDRCQTGRHSGCTGFRWVEAVGSTVSHCGGRVLVVGFALALLLSATAGEANPLTFNYTAEYTGGTSPTGPPPWLQATFSDHAQNQVLLHLEALQLSGTEFVTTWLFNLDPALDPGNLTVDPYGGSVVHSSYDTGADQFNRGSARFDLRIDFPTANNGGRFGPGDSSDLLLTWSPPMGPGLPPLSSGASFGVPSFSFLSGGNLSIPASTHVQGIPTGTGSGWLTPTGQPIPEPGTLVLIGSGLLGLAARRRRSSR